VDQGTKAEKATGGLAAVFPPGAPNPHSGAVYFVPADRIRSSEVKLVAALNGMRRCGIGAAALLKDFSGVATAHS
jgi:uncharacterized membrane protein